MCEMYARGSVAMHSCRCMCQVVAVALKSLHIELRIRIAYGGPFTFHTCEIEHCEGKWPVEIMEIIGFLPYYLSWRSARHTLSFLLDDLDSTAPRSLG